jgi:hypothetical protein
MAEKKCRVCESTDLIKFLSLGDTPLVNSLLKREQLELAEPKYPLDVYFCKNCNLVQLADIVPPEIMFRNYLYVSGISDTMRLHFSELAESIVKRFNLSPESLVVDIGGNDGTLLKSFKNFGVKVLNVEPAHNIAKMSVDNGIETINEFWDEYVASKIKKSSGGAKIIIGTNVFAHVDNLDDFMRGVKTLLSDDGVFIVEVPYLVDLIKKKEFDTIYHEHLSYFALKPLITLFSKFGMVLFDVERVGVHGGSIRVFVKRGLENQSDSVKELLKLEENEGLSSLEIYENFAKNVEMIKEKLVSLLKKLKDNGKSIVGYGAPAKGNVLLNYCKIGTDLLEYTVDKTPIKQGLYTPGMRIPVFPPEKIVEDMPDYVLILSWNFADEIIKQQQKYKELGGKFIIPIPEPKII